MNVPVPPPDPVSQALGHLRVALQDGYLQVARRLGITASQAELLCAAMRPAAVGRLAEVLRCDRTNVSHLVDRAAARGWVERRVDDNDRRSSLIALTADGERLAREFTGQLQAQLRPLLETWSRERRRNAAALLHELADELDRAASNTRARPPART